LDGLSDKQDQHWQDLHKEKLLLLKALEQLREKELLLLKNKAPHSSMPARGTLCVFVLLLCFSSFYLPLSNPFPVFFLSSSLTVSCQHA
jgi:hypothetical protein